MLIPDNANIYLYAGVTDMRKSINTLAIMVQEVFDISPSSGHLFLFRSRQKNKLKALYYQQGSYTLWYRRLDKGKFSFPRNQSGKIELSIEHFKWLLASNLYTEMPGENNKINHDFY
jgi:transposase